MRRFLMLAGALASLILPPSYALSQAKPDIVVPNCDSSFVQPISAGGAGFGTVDAHANKCVAGISGSSGSNAAAGATGWWSNLRTFSLDRFNPPLGGGRLPVERYLSAALLNRVTHYELDVLRRVAPEAVNGLPTDELYAGEGSQPQRSKEVLQSWDALRALNQQLAIGDQIACLRRCRRAIQLATQLYAEASARGVSFEPKSNDEHLGELAAGLDLFERLAELDTR